MSTLTADCISTFKRQAIVLSRKERTSTYLLGLAQSQEEIGACQKLRFAVFNLELNEGLPESFFTGKDADPFDAVCDHLLVQEKETGEVVGTYRLQTGVTALRNQGYYSAQEFNLDPFDSRRPEMLELGRACVHRDHRNLAVLGLLWKGIAIYAKVNEARFLIGCSSLNSTDPAAGAATYAYLSADHLAPADWQTTPRAAFACPLPATSLFEKPDIPRLLAAYISMGANICGPPALDRQFKTIDFLTVLDLRNLSARTAARYLG